MTFLPGLVSLMRTKRIAVTVNEIGSLILCATFLNFGGRMYSLPTAVQPCEKKRESMSVERVLCSLMLNGIESEKTVNWRQYEN